MQPSAIESMGNPGPAAPFSGAILFNAVITPAALSADQNNYNPPGFANCNVLRLKTSDAFTKRTISGLAGGKPGRLIIIENIGLDGTNTGILLDGTAGSSSVINQFDTSSGVPRHLDNGEMTFAIYDGKSQKWRIIGLGLPNLDNVIHSDLDNTYQGLNTFDIRGIRVTNSSDVFDGVYGALYANTDPDNSLITAVYLIPSTDNTNRLFIGVSGSKWLAVNFANVSEFQKVPLISTYNGVATQGWGVVAVQKVGRFLAQSAAKANIISFTPAADGSFEVSANVLLISTGIGSSFTVTVTYVSEDNTSRTLTLPFSSAAGTFLTPITAVGVYEGVALHIRAKAGNAITMQTVGTFNTISYNVECALRQLA